MPSGSDDEKSELTAGGTGTGSGIRQKHERGNYSPHGEISTTHNHKFGYSYTDQGTDSLPLSVHLVK